ncbi:MAG: hypothetical protein ABEK36_05315 [Candidatus Aenigmatarchaeota archaeon]
MEKKEINELQNLDFLKKLLDYEYNNVDELITTAVVYTFVAVEVVEHNLPDDFISICKNIGLL